MHFRIIFSLFFFISLLSCRESIETETPLFNLTSAKETGVTFQNTLSYTEDFNPYLYRNFYNGGGVALGDINNDGLLDIYFSGNIVDNKLYLNKGNFQFEDITTKAGVSCPNVWSSGVTFVDINSDGFLDIYVCKSGKPEGQNRNNELFINNGDLTFTEKSKEYGLNVKGLSVHAAFLDFDKDGDLDCYLLNNSIKSIGGYDLIIDQRKTPSTNGNKLLLNNNGVFIDVSQTYGIYSSAIGFGLGVTLSDFNNDNWPDMFISNDFFEKDYLYLNDKGTRFIETSDSLLTSLSMGSMGADAGDLNNDFLSEIMVAEMLPATLERKKTKAIFESWEKYTLAEKKGYANQLPRNVLQENKGADGFFEISRKTGLDATEWSWSTLFFDMNNDGFKDIFISNGIYKDLLDRDYLNYMSEPGTMKQLMQNNAETITKMIDVMPSKAISNAAFINYGDLNFIKKTDSLGLAEPSFSNGSAYGDLDNDGDLDLVINNVNMPSFLYENKSNVDNSHYLKIRFEGNNKNTNGIGAKIYAFYDNNKKSYFENFSSRGYQSTVAPEIIVGLGNTITIDSLRVIWPTDEVSLYTNLISDTTLVIKQSTAKNLPISYHTKPAPILTETPPLYSYRHTENNTVDFNKEQLLDRMTSNEGPAFANADINKDGIPDYYLGGAKNETSQLFISSKTGYTIISDPFILDKASEDIDALFFDSDNDGDLDLYVCSGGKSFSKFDKNLNDRLYINQGNGEYKKSSTPLPFTHPICTATVAVNDYDKDGDIDIFIGERYNPGGYGSPANGYLLENMGYNTFSINKQDALLNLGMITSSAWVDLNNDSFPDLVVAGEWMPLSIFINKNGILLNRTNDYKLNQTTGIWSSLKVVDIDQDGDQDFIVGNIGSNYAYSSNTTLFFNDFDKNGKTESILCQKINNKYYPMLDKDELISQLPHLKKKLLYYKDYAKYDLAELLGEDIFNQSIKYELKTTQSTLFINENNGFKHIPLSQEAQYSIVYAIETDDVNDDGNLDIILGGNQELIKPQYGKLDASRGWIIYGNGNAYDFSKTKGISLRIQGQIRHLSSKSHNSKKILTAIINNSDVKFYEYKK
ncbi:VCBS repeat-containing protein [Aurantibacter sp.]|uniref:VCBS repeat-containing protein n=1 Tax=Aurantibacter sp. TaxID=2807103 RepID=UPI003264409E